LATILHEIFASWQLSSQTWLLSSRSAKYRYINNIVTMQDGVQLAKFRHQIISLRASFRSHRVPLSRHAHTNFVACMNFMQSHDDDLSIRNLLNTFLASINSSFSCKVRPCSTAVEAEVEHVFSAFCLDGFSCKMF